MKDELGGGIMTEFLALKAKTYSYLRDDDTETKEKEQRKKGKGTRKCVIERMLMHPDYKNCVLNNKYNGITTYPYEYKHWESMQNRDTK